MTPPISKETHTQLVQLSEQLAMFATVCCGLMHEQVLEISGGTVTDTIDLDKLDVRRKGFCNMDIRRKLLGCAHTKANDIFARLVDAVYDTGILSTAFPPSTTVNDLSLKIYLLDHEKGQMEKRYALACQKGEEHEIKAVEQVLKDILARHETILSQLEQLRQSIMDQIHNAIDQYNPLFSFLPVQEQNGVFRRSDR
jgi:hypothetical protein